jgi:hypothetical protein
VFGVLCLVVGVIISDSVAMNPWQGVEKGHERLQDKAKSNEKAEFMCDK